MQKIHNVFLDNNLLIEHAISRFYTERSRENVLVILDAIRHRIHEDGHLIFPVWKDEEHENRFAFRSIQTKDGKAWNAAFTSKAEFEKGDPSDNVSFPIDRALRLCLGTDADGFVINPWGQSFMLSRELIEMILKEDGEEYHIPDDPITSELLEDGSFLKRAISICSRNRTQINLIKLSGILRDSWVWIPCTAVMSDADQEMWDKAVKPAQDGEGLDSLIGQEFTNKDTIRMIPDILQNGDQFFFPVFTSAEEMGEYGEHFSKVQKHFLEAVNLAVNNEKNVSGIVINAFSDPFVVPREMFDAITKLKSSIKGEEENE